MWQALDSHRQINKEINKSGDDIAWLYTSCKPHKNCQVLYPFIHLGGERHCVSKVSCPRTQHNVPGQGSNPGRSLWSRAQLWGHCVSHYAIKVRSKEFFDKLFMYGTRGDILSYPLGFPSSMASLNTLHILRYANTKTLSLITSHCSG